MKLVEVSINGFRCWRDATLAMEAYTCLIGKNDSGKSAFLRAVAFLFDPDRSWDASDTCSIAQVEGGEQSDTDYFVEAQFEECDDSLPVSYEGRCRLRRYRNGTYEADGPCPKHPAIEALSLGLKKSSFREIFDDASQEWQILPVELKKKRSWSAADCKSVFAHLDACGLIEFKPGSRHVGEDEVRTSFVLLFLDADTRAADVTAGGRSAFAVLANRITEDALRSDIVVRESFESLKKRVEQLCSEPSGDNPVSTAMAAVAEELSAELQRFNSRVVADVDTTPAKIAFPSVSTLLTVKDDWTADMQKFGHGLQRTLVFSLLNIVNKRASAKVEGEWVPFKIVLVEEPELYLHPQAERKRAADLHAIAATPQTSVVVATHSAHFVDIVDFMGIKLVSRDNDRTSTVLQWDKGSVFAESDREELILVKAFNPTATAMFFAEKVFLCEGQTEKVSVPLVLEKLGLDPSGCEVVDCEGAAKIAPIQQVLEGFRKHYVAIYDFDKSKEHAKRGLEIAQGGQGNVVVLVNNWEDVAGVKTSDKNKVVDSYRKFSDTDVVVPERLAAALIDAWNGVNHLPTKINLGAAVKKDILDQINDGDLTR